MGRPSEGGFAWPAWSVLKPSTLQTIVDGYLDSQDFLKLAERTQRDYRKHARTIVAAFGDMPLDVFLAESEDQLRGLFLGWRDKLAKTSKRQADHAWSVLSAVLSWSRKHGFVKINPCRGADVEKLYDGNRADKIWNDDWITAFYNVASEELALAMALALWTGQRQGDLLSGVGSLFGFAEGGPINGGGTGTSDSNLALVTDGEYIVNAEATAKNKAPLNAINSDKAPGVKASVLTPVSTLIANTTNSTSDARQTSNHYTVQNNITTPNADSFRKSSGQIAADASVHIQRLGVRNR